MHLATTIGERPQHPLQSSQSHGRYLLGPLCHLVHSLQTEHYSTEDTLYQYLTPVGKLYPSHKDLY